MIPRNSKLKDSSREIPSVAGSEVHNILPINNVEGLSKTYLLSKYAAWLSLTYSGGTTSAGNLCTRASKNIFESDGPERSPDGATATRRGSLDNGPEPGRDVRTRLLGEDLVASPRLTTRCYFRVDV